MICTPWATINDICEPCSSLGLSSDTLEVHLLSASQVLYALSGRQFTGAGCTATVRPELPCVDYGPCDGPSQILLPHYPVTEITEVRVRQQTSGDLVVLAEDQYRLDNHSALVRLKDADGYHPWPRQDLRQNDDGTGPFLEISYTYGAAPPLLGKKAAATLACEFALACDPDADGKCRLPKNVQNVVRQGVTQEFVDVEQFLAEDLMGIFDVDLFLRVVNPHKLRRRATVWSPDLPAFH